MQLSVLFCLLLAVGCGGNEGAATANMATNVDDVTASTIPGLYFFQINTQRGPIVGNWSFHADGTFFSSAGGTETLAGTWVTDGTNISLVQSIPYGNTCHYSAPLTATGFATKDAPSTQASCTFNHLNPNPRKSWYAIKL
jgi:hypothetical protein